jgi:hypothetical protein
MKEVTFTEPGLSTDAASFLACLATILELPPERLPRPSPREDPATGWTLSRWLGGLGLGIAPVAEPAEFAWPGPWIARVRPSGRPDRGPGEGPARKPGHGSHRRSVVMYGVPSGAVWDPLGDGQVEVDKARIEDGFLIAASDIALALPPRPEPPSTAGVIANIWIAASAGRPAQRIDSVRAVPGRGLEGDRHFTGTGTFPSGLPGSALTLIEAEVCDTFQPALGPDEHRRNIVTRGIALGRLVGHEFTIGPVRCRGMRLCEPCTVIQRRASRPLLRELVHRGGLRADILTDGVIETGHPITAR